MEEIEEKVGSVLNSSWLVPAIVGVAGFASGLGVGFKWAKNKYYLAEVHQFPAPVEMDFDETPDETEITIPEPVVIDKETALEKGIIKVDDLSSLRPSMLGPEADPEIVAEVITVEETVTVEEEVEQPQYEGDDGDEIIEPLTDGFAWDWDEELPNRNETEPYVITEDEYVLGEKNYRQIALTYYTEDNTLVDEDDAPIYNWSTVIGPLAFGHGTRNEDMFFVRNDMLKTEYEVEKLEKSHAQSLLGDEIEGAAERSDLRHSQDRRFRASD